MRRGPSAIVVVLTALLGGACVGGDGASTGSTDGDAGPDAGPSVDPEIHIGVPDEETMIQYEPLDPGGDIRLESYGQGGLHAVFIVQIIGFGNQAWVDLTVRNLGDYDRRDPGDGGLDGADAGADEPPDGPSVDGVVMTAPWRQPRLLACDDLLAPVVCRDAPRIVMLGGLTGELATLGDLHVEVQADVRNRDGLMLSTTTDGYLRR